MEDILAQSGLGKLEATAPALSWGRQMAREVRRTRSRLQLCCAVHRSPPRLYTAHVVLFRTRTPHATVVWPQLGSVAKRSLYRSYHILPHV